MTNPSLKGAYALASPDEAKQLYADWAETYDDAFAASMDFVLPLRVAEALAATGARGPVLDFGAGTGIVGEHLKRLGVEPVDALDLSPEMLAVAGRKRVYRSLIEGNLLDGLHLPARYNGVISSGTFTLGHVGPGAIAALLAVALPAAQFVLSIHKDHYREAAFAAEFDRLSDQITGFELREVPFYGPNAPDAHRDTTGFLAQFNKSAYSVS